MLTEHFFYSNMNFSLYYRLEGYNETKNNDYCYHNGFTMDSFIS